MADITMPQLGETVTEGTITKWLKNVGDKIEEDEIIYEVSTDKVDSEVPSPVAGYLREIRVAEGDTAEVGAVLAVVGDAPPAGGATPASAAEPAAPAPESDGGGPEPTAGSDVATAAPGPEVTGAANSDGAATVEPAQAALTTVASGEGDGDATGKVLSPVVRRLIAEHDLDAARIVGTGSGGRITRGDVLAVIDAGGDQPSQPAQPAAPAPAPAAVPPPPPAATRTAPARVGERDEVVPFSNIRRRTAEHMVRSLATSAHTLVVIDVDYENVDRVRVAAKERFKEEEGATLSYIPFIARALIDAIREFPHANSSVGDDELLVHRYVNLGIAVDLNFQGLIVPVIHDADAKRLRALARELGDLGRRAKSKKLSADEIAGGTFTITNAGGFGTLITGPIINQPQVAILSTDGVKPRPVAVELPDGTFAITVHPVGNLALSWDHRAFDGAYASAFLARIKEIVETRDWAAELS